MASPEPESVDLNELFSRDPLELSDTDLAKLAAHYRAEALTWQNNPTPKKSPAKTATPVPDKLSLSDLGLA